LQNGKLTNGEEAGSHSLPPVLQLIFSAFKTLTNQTVTVELKNDIAVTGTLKSVDQFLNFRIDNLKVVEGDEEKWPHFVSSAFGI
jgi:U6 snRNA-associated Sm-like protein LSm2